MNIFVLDLDPVVCAAYHNDRHVVKMITESAQMLSTACRTTGLDVGYQITHLNHPCSLWVRESQENWIWLWRLAKFLNIQWKERFNHSDRDHKSFDIIFSLPIPPLPRNGLTPFAQAMPEQYRNDDPVQAYRSYYMGEKRHIAQWKNGIPEWWV